MTAGQSRRFVITGQDPEGVVGPVEVATCPYCTGTTGVEVITNTPPKVQAWRCVECRTDWAFTVVNPHLRQRYLDELAAEVVARSVLREVTALAEQVDTLTDGQMLARLIGCLARLDQACRRSAASKFPAGHRPNNGVPGAPPVPRSTGAAPDATGTGTTR